MTFNATAEKKSKNPFMPAPNIQTLGQLRDSGYTSKSVRDELRTNLMQRIQNQEPVFNGIIGYEDTVIPQI